VALKHFRVANAHRSGDLHATAVAAILPGSPNGRGALLFRFWP
jgi:hypothetical protein